MKKVQLPSGESVPALGMGTWYMGNDPAKRREEIATLRLGIDLGAGLIDTAEMYGNGTAEELVGEAIRNGRDNVFLVSKVLPSNATHRGTVAACEGSLRRLQTDHLDLYLLHWRGSVPFSETLAGFLELQKAGKIRHFGVSNLDLDELKEFCAERQGGKIQTNQLLYNLTRRNIEYALLPWLREKGIPVMAYSPIEQGRLLKHKELVAFARAQGMTPAQTALSWLLAQKDIIAIPKTSRRQRLEENLGALNYTLNPQQLAELDRLFPPPTRPQPLEML